MNKKSDAEDKEMDFYMFCVLGIFLLFLLLMFLFLALGMGKSFVLFPYNCTQAIGVGFIGLTC